MSDDIDKKEDATEPNDKPQQAAKPWRIYSWGLSDVGMKREHNEDSYLCVPERNLFVVADGMGGHAGGEMASGVAVRTIDKVVRERSELIAEDRHYEGEVDKNPVAKLVSDSVRAACAAVYHKSQEVMELKGMGTTTVVSLYHGKYLFIGHVGDSRAYLLRDGHLVQLTDDHSLVNEQLKAGLITEQQAKNSRFKNIITRSVGFEEDVDVDIIAVEIRPGDAVLLCSDGLSGLVEDDEIKQTIMENFLRQAPEMLIDLANRRGGDDNSTVVLTYISDAKEKAWDDKADEALPPLVGGAAHNAGLS